MSPPAILEATVIAIPDDFWGEVPKALVVLKAGESATAEEIIEPCRGKIANFRLPKSVEFVTELPKGGHRQDLEERAKGEVLGRV